MKLSQYYQLENSHLKLTEHMYKVPNKNFYLFEDENELETEKSTVAAIFTRWGKMKSKLNNVAKKIQDNISNKILDKYLDNILKTEVELNNFIKTQISNSKNKNEIISQAKQKAASIKKIQDAQLKIVYDAIDKFIQNSSAKMTEKIENSKMNEKNKINLKNYWLLLQTQLKLNAYNKISASLLKSAKNSIGEENIEIYKQAVAENSITSTIGNLKSEVETNSKTVKDMESKMKAEDTVSEGGRDFNAFYEEIVSILDEYKTKDKEKMKSLLSSLKADVNKSTKLNEEDKKKLLDWFEKNGITDSTASTSTNDNTQNRGGKEDVQL